MSQQRDRSDKGVALSSDALRQLAASAFTRTQHLGIRLLGALEQSCGTLTATDAHGDNTIFLVAAFQFTKYGAGKA